MPARAVSTVVVRGIGRRLRRGASGGAVVLTLLAVSTLAPSSAGAARSELFGIVQGATLDSRDLQGLKRARIHTDRFMLNWGWVQPRAQGTFNWAGPDRLIGALASHGVRAFPAFWGNPEWVYGSSSRPPIDRPRSIQAWQAFLKAAVARYGPGGAYWSTKYRQLYGPHATPLPIQSWQIWNEPNLSKYFGPSPSPRRYAQLLRISHNAIKSKDPNAQIVLAGMPGFGEVRAWDFLRGLYSVAGIKGYFDATALHPYARDLSQFRQQIGRFRMVMKNHSDGATPLWLTELGWGSAPPDRFGINQGPQGQEKLLRGSFKLVLTRRKAWNVQRLFWFHWRDPQKPRKHTCSFCASAGLLRHDRKPKPSLATFRSFTAEWSPPQVSIISGPSQGATTNDPTPTFRFASNEPGSTFKCRFGTRVYESCSSPFTPLPPLADGSRTFWVRAIDAPGNVSAAASRSFRVDTVAPKTSISSGPANGATSGNRRPSFEFSANEPGTSFQCQLDAAGLAPCTSPYATGRLEDGQHSFQVQATDGAGNVGPAVTRTWTVAGPAPASGTSSGPADESTSSDAGPSIDKAAPRLRIKGPATITTRTRKASAAFTLKASERAELRCRISARQFRPCPAHYRAPRLHGPHTLKVKAIDSAGNVALRRKRFRVVTRGPSGATGGSGIQRRWMRIAGAAEPASY